MLKVRLCPHNNKDKIKHKFQKDPSKAQFDALWLLLFHVTLLKFRIVCFDIKKAYLQSGPIKREIYVRSASELQEKREIW